MTDTMITPAQVAGYAEKIMALVGDDIAGGAVPADGCASFSELHDHVDANDYLLEAGVPFGTDPGAGAEGCEAVNAVCAEVSCRLATRASAARAARARAELMAADVAERIRDEVAKWPPLTDEQRAELALILRGGKS